MRVLKVTASVGGKRAILDYLRNYDDKGFGITSITEFKLFCADLKEKKIIMIDKFETLNFDRSSAINAGLVFKDLRKASKMPKIKDLMITSIWIEKQEAYNKRSGFRDLRG